MWCVWTGRRAKSDSVEKGVWKLVSVAPAPNCVPKQSVQTRLQSSTATSTLHSPASLLPVYCRDRSSLQHCKSSRSRKKKPRLYLASLTPAASQLGDDAPRACARQHPQLSISTCRHNHPTRPRQRRHRAQHIILPRITFAYQESSRSATTSAKPAHSAHLRSPSSRHGILFYRDAAALVSSIPLLERPPCALANILQCVHRAQHHRPSRTHRLRLVQRLVPRLRRAPQPNPLTSLAPHH